VRDRLNRKSPTSSGAFSQSPSQYQPVVVQAGGSADLAQLTYRMCRDQSL
jgi:hypothetical protein